jgi:hypothetical protein
MAAYTPSQQSLLLLALMQQEENAKRAQMMQQGQSGGSPISGEALESILGGGTAGGGAYVGSGMIGGGATSAAAVPGILSAAPAAQIAPAIPGMAAAAPGAITGGTTAAGMAPVAAGVSPVVGAAGVVAIPAVGSVLLKQAAKRFFNKQGIPRSFKSQDVLTSRTLGRSIPGFENLSPEDKVRLAEQGYKAGVVKFSGHDERMNKLSADKQAEIAARYRAAGLPEPTSDSTVNVRGDELMNLDRYRTNMNLAARYGGEDAGISKGIWERFKPEPELNAYERATAPEKVRAFLDELDAAKIPKAGTGTAMGKPAVIGGMTPKKQTPGVYGSIPKAK